jgi:flagellum-specific peptidoglycan hydrolase FlgJ
MNKEQIEFVIREKCLKPFGDAARIAWDIEDIADALLLGSEQYHVDPILALAQGILECHFGYNPAALRSRKTRNIFNVGNVDNGGNRFFKTMQAGIEAYFRLMAREYHWRDEGPSVTLEMMLKHDFRRPRGGRYATSPSYTRNIASIAASITKLLAPKGEPEPKPEAEPRPKKKGSK